MKKIFLTISLGCLLFACADPAKKELPPIYELNFEVEKFTPEEGKEWQGKTLLLEYFVGAECPPCLGISLAIEGLLERYDRKYLTVIENHIKIPGPDPMENRYSHLRGVYYGVYRAPMTFFDGNEKFRGGGADSVANDYYNIFKKEIEKTIYEKPELKLNVEAQMKNDSLIVVNVETDKLPEGITFQVALIEKQVDYLGHNRSAYHKNVLRNRQPIEIGIDKKGTYTFNLHQTEQIGEKWLKGIEKNFAPYKFKEKHFKLNWNNLEVIVFAEDSKERIIYNSASTDIK